MTADLPDSLQGFDNELMSALSQFAPPADLDQRISAHLNRRGRLRLVLSPAMVKSAAAVVAIGLLGTIGYVADRNLNAGSPNGTPHAVLMKSLLEEKRMYSNEFLGEQAYPRPAERDGQNVLYADGHAEWAGRPYAGTQNDNIYAKREGKKADASVPKDGHDSVLLPTADPEPAPASRPPAPRGGTAQEDLKFNDRAQPQDSARNKAAKADQSGSDAIARKGERAADQEMNAVKTDIQIPSGETLMIGGTTLRGSLEKEVGVKLGVQFDSDTDEKDGRDGQPAQNAQHGMAANTGTALDSRANGESPGGEGKVVDRFRPGQLASSARPGNGRFGGGGGGGSGEGEERNKQSLKGTDGKLVANKPGENKPVQSQPIDGTVTEASQSTPTPALLAAGDGPAAAVNPPDVKPGPVATIVQQRVIRSGTVEFEVDSFDSALMTVTKLVMEDGGFVASTDSNKLPNGKTRGVISIRIPPDRLDTFILKLRGLGDLKSQKISAQDVSKAYSDVESSLRAARAMETRLLEMIQKGQGQIKDLLAAEKELGVWRQKIEQCEGEKRYYDNLISLSTLSIALQERDIKASSAAIETETVSAGVEIDDVEKARGELIKDLDDAKARIITSDLKKLDAGQFACNIVAEVAPEKAGPIVDRLKQLGKVARLDIDRRQTTLDGSTAPVAGAHVEKKPTTLSISLYNLANVAPRLTTTMAVAADDVQTRYREVMATVEKAGGRVVQSNLQRPRADEVLATLSIECPSAQAAGLQAALQAVGEVMNLQLSENPDTANVTTAKQGFSLRIISATAVAARETVSVQLASKDVTAAHRMMAEIATKAGSRIVQSNVVAGDRDNLTAVLQLDLPRSAEAEWEQMLPKSGDVLTRSTARSSDIQNTLDSKVRINLSILAADRIAPRETTTLQVGAKDVVAAHRALADLANKAGARVLQSNVAEGDRDRLSATLQIDLPRLSIPDWEKSLAQNGEVLTRSVVRSSDTQNTLDNKVRISATIFPADRLPPRQTTTATLNVDGAEGVQSSFIALAEQLGGRVMDQNVNRDPTGRNSARVVLDLPRDKAPQMIKELRDSGEIWSMNTTTNAQAPDGPLSRSRFDLTLAEGEALVGKNAGVWQSIRDGLSTSLHGLGWSLQLIIVGLCLVAPWVLILWFGWKMLKRLKRKPTVAV